MTTTQHTLNSTEDTENLGKHIGSKLRGGECVELVSDLGGGKTTFVRGLAEGAGSRDIVASPTFTIGKQYTTGNLRIYHYDFYRLFDPGIVAEELAEALQDPHGVVVVEWGRSVDEVLPETRVRIELMKRADNPDHRLCEIKVPDPQTYLLEGM